MNRLKTFSALLIFFLSLTETIENSIDRAAGNVEEGTEQLIKAAQSQNKYRKKLFILVGIATIIVIILIVILVTELKK